jgi:hypothetical protein
MTTPPVASPAHLALETVHLVVPREEDRARLRDYALRRNGSRARFGSAVAEVLDARVTGWGVSVDLAVPTDVRPVDLSQFSSRSAAEILQFLYPIVESLAALHDAGLAHGGIVPGSLRMRRDGSGFVAGIDPAAQPGDDVSSVASMMLDLLPRDSVDGDLVGLLLRAADGEGSARPSMVQLAYAIAVRRDREQAAPSGGSAGSPGFSPPARRRVTVTPPEAHSMSFPVDDPVLDLRQRRARARGRARTRSLGLPSGTLWWVAGSSAVTWVMAALVFGID